VPMTPLLLALALCGKLVDITPIHCHVPSNTVKSLVRRCDCCGHLCSPDSTDHANVSSQQKRAPNWKLNASNISFWFEPTDYHELPICTIESSWVRLAHPLTTRHTIRCGWAYSLVFKWQGWIAKIPCERDTRQGDQ
jgi:hypothetical protein